MDQTHEAAARYEQLRDYLSADPDNLRLIAEAAEAAFHARRPGDAAGLVDLHARTAPPPPSLINLLGLCALAEGRWDDAAAIFSSLLAEAPDDPALRFNLAWAKSRAGDHQAALDQLGGDPATPQAAALRVRSLHHLGRPEEAISVGDAWEGRSDDPDLWSALASAALDIEDLDRAARWAPRGGATAEGQAALGLLAMADGDPGEARAFFDRALALRPDSARGRLGLGSALLAGNEAADAALQFDEAATIFADHLGSWIAAGWAWLLAGDPARARERFEKAAALDDTFSEAHGGLALLDFREGRHDDARRRAEVALRLDSQSLGGLLVRSLLLEQAGEADTARRLIDRALRAPVGPRGQSIVQIVALQAATGRA